MTVAKPFWLPLAYASVAAFTLCSPVASGNPLAPLQKAGLRLIPPTPAPDFSLPDLEGQTHRLSEYRGKLVLLHFWASWCGPCKVEFPTIERLQLALQKDGVQVVAVAADSASPADLKGFVSQLGPHLTVLRDKDGDVAGKYRAMGLPTTYILDASGNLLAMASGALQWDNPGILAALREAAGGQPAAAGTGLGAGAPGTATAGPGPSPDQLALPPDLEPPQATVSWDPENPEAGQPLDLIVSLTWTSKSRTYRLAPPTVTVPAEVTAGDVRAESESAPSGSERLVYRLRYIVGAEGSMAFSPIEVRYWEAGMENPQSARITGPTVTVVPATWLGMRPLLLLVITSALVSAVGLGAGIGLWLRARRRRPSKNLSASGEEAFRQLLDSAERARIAGDAAGVLTPMLAAMRLLGNGPRANILDQQLEKTRYAGLPPDPTHLKSLIREVELAVNERYPQREED